MNNNHCIVIDVNTLVKFGVIGVGITLTTNAIKVSGQYLICNRKEIYKGITNTVSSNSFITGSKILLSGITGLMVPTFICVAKETNHKDLMNLYFNSNIPISAGDIFRDAHKICLRKSNLLVLSGISFGLFSIWLFTSSVISIFTNSSISNEQKENNSTSIEQKENNSTNIEQKENSHVSYYFPYQITTPGTPVAPLSPVVPTTSSEVF
jgi:hypothetical protein